MNFVISYSCVKLDNFGKVIPLLNLINLLLVIPVLNLIDLVKLFLC